MIIKIKNNGSIDFIDLDKALGVNIESNKLTIKFPNFEYEINFYDHKEELEIIEAYFVNLYKEFGPKKSVSIYPDPLYKED